MSEFSHHKIFFLIGTFDLGGAEKQAIEIARFFKEQIGSQVIFCAFSKKVGMASNILDNYNIERVGFSVIDGHGWINKIIELIKYLIFIRKYRPDILMPFTSLPNVIAALSWRWGRAKSCIWNQRDVIEGSRYDFIKKFVIKFIPEFVSNSEIGKKYLVNNFNLKESKITVINNGIFADNNFLVDNYWRDKLKIAKENIVVTSVANLSKNKDHSVLLYAWKKVLENVKNKSIKLCLAGRFDSEYGCLLQLVKDLEMGDSVFFLGPIKEISQLLKESDVGVLSAHNEGCPNVILEYAAIKLPIIATDIPGIREILGENYEYLAPVNDSDRMAELILYFINNPTIAKEVAEHNFQRVTDVFSATKMYSSYFDLVKRILV